MADWNTRRDIRMTRDGDLMWGRGDFAHVTDEECAAQDAHLYLHTQIGGYGYWPMLGNRLFEKIGEMVQDATPDEIRLLVLECVTMYGRVPADQLRVIVREFALGEFAIRVDLETSDGFLTLLPEMVFNSSGIWRED